jgi:four helix bundle protein
MKKKEFVMETKMEESKSQIPKPNEIPTPNSQIRRKPYDLRERTFEFAVRVLSIVAAIPKEGTGRIIADQLSRSGSSVGANVEEADGAVTRADKRKTLIVARKEVREARYWLRLLDRVWGSKVPVRAEIGEATELLYILSSIIDQLHTH